MVIRPFLASGSLGDKGWGNGKEAVAKGSVQTDVLLVDEFSTLHGLLQGK